MIAQRFSGSASDTAAVATHERQSALLTKSLVFLFAVTAISQARADNAKDNPQPPAAGKMEKTSTMTNGDAWKIYARYLEGWRATSDEQRRKIAVEVVAENVLYTTPRHETGNRNTVIEDMATFQSKFPGGHFDIGDVSAHHDVALLTWVLVQADGKIYAKGHDQIRVSPDGKIASIITFAPSVTKP